MALFRDRFQFEDLFVHGGLRLNKQLLRTAAQSIAPCETVNIAILTDATVKEMADYSALFLRLKGVVCHFWIGSFNQVAEDAMFRINEIASFAPNLILIHDTGRSITNKSTFSDLKARACAIWESLLILECPIIQTTIPFPGLRPGDSYDLINSCGVQHITTEINLWYAKESAKRSYLYILDLNYLSAYEGLKEWHDDRMWYLYGYAYSPSVAPVVAYAFAKLILSVIGRGHKLIILDLDNTLWGGVWAEESGSDVLLGGETAVGRAYAVFQQYLFQLKQAGLIFAICSKNNFDSVKDCFDQPNSLFRWDDFSAVKVNWRPKPENISMILSVLNLTPDSVIFLDDNPAERMEVSDSFPDMWIPPFDRVENFPNLLQKGLIFEKKKSTKEDTLRTQYYADNNRREDLRKQYSDRSNYLKALNMKLHLLAPERFSERLAQLINKTHQFQMTGKRFSEVELSNYIKNNTVLAASLSDIFGDNGIISTIGVSCNGKIASIDFWVMSCRVFQRDVEYAMYNSLIQTLQQRKIEKIRVVFRETEKNVNLKNLLATLGFCELSRDNRGILYEAEITRCVRQNSFIEVCND